MSKRAANSGFTLIEALVSLVLAGGGIAALVSSIGATERAEARALQSEKMQRLAYTKLEEILASRDFVSQGGDFNDRGESDFEWNLEQNTTSVENLTQLTVSVTKTTDSSVKQTLSTLVFDPPTATANGGAQ